MKNVKELFSSITNFLLSNKDRNNLLSEENKNKIIYLINKDTKDYVYFYPNIKVLLKILCINDKKCNIKLSSLPKYDKYYFSLKTDINIDSRTAISLLFKNNFDNNSINIIKKLGISPRKLLLSKLDINSSTKICQINKDSMNIAHIYNSYNEVLDFINSNKNIYANNITKDDIINAMNFISSHLLLDDYFWVTLDLIKNNFNFLLEKYINKQNKKNNEIKDINNIDLSDYIVQLDPISFKIINIYRNVKDLADNCDLISKYGKFIINNIVNCCKHRCRKSLDKLCHYGYLWMYYKEAKLFYSNSLNEFIKNNNIFLK